MRIPGPSAESGNRTWTRPPEAIGKRVDKIGRLRDLIRPIYDPAPTQKTEAAAGTATAKRRALLRNMCPRTSAGRPRQTSRCAFSGRPGGAGRLPPGLRSGSMASRRFSTNPKRKRGFARGEQREDLWSAHRQSEACGWQAYKAMEEIFPRREACRSVAEFPRMSCGLTQSSPPEAAQGRPETQSRWS